MPVDATCPDPDNQQELCSAQRIGDGGHDMRLIACGQIVGFIVLLAAPARSEMAPATALSRLKAVGREGEGNAAAARAWKEVVAQGPSALPAILTAMDGT